jgi:hypothetical protein
MIIKRDKKGRIIDSTGQDTNKYDTAGRPTVMTPEVIAKLEKAFAIGATDIEACAFAGICETTLYYYQQKNPEFKDRKKRLKEQPILKAKNTVVANLDDVKNAQWYLERKKKDEFGQRTEITGAEGGQLQQLIIVKAKELQDGEGNQPKQLADKSVG